MSLSDRTLHVVRLNPDADPATLDALPAKLGQAFRQCPVGIVGVRAYEQLTAAGAFAGDNPALFDEGTDTDGPAYRSAISSRHWSL